MILQNDPSYHCQDIDCCEGIPSPFQPIPKLHQPDTLIRRFCWRLGVKHSKAFPKNIRLVYSQFVLGFWVKSLMGPKVKKYMILKYHLFKSVSVHKPKKQPMRIEVHIKVGPIHFSKFAGHTADPSQHIPASHSVEGFLGHFNIFPIVWFQVRSGEESTLCPFCNL